MRYAIAVLAAVLLAGCSSGGGTPKAATTPAAHPRSAHRAAPGEVSIAGTIRVAPKDSIRAFNSAYSPCWTFGNEPYSNGGTGPFADVRKGAQVVVTNAKGAVVGVGHLEAGHTPRRGSRVHRPPCDFSFATSLVPLGSPFYGVKVGGHSEQVPAARISAPVVALG